MRALLLVVGLMMTSQGHTQELELAEACSEWLSYHAEKQGYDQNKELLAQQGINADTTDPSAKRRLSAAKGKFESKKRAYEKASGKKFSEKKCPQG